MSKETAHSAVTVEFDFRNSDTRFWPIGRIIRGRFVRLRADDVKIRAALGIPDEIPGQQISVDTLAKRGFILEPIQSLNDLKKQLEAFGSFRFAPAKEEFRDIDVDEWFFYLKRWVDAGHAKLVSGAFPSEINYRQPRNPLVPEPRGTERIKQIFFENPSVASAYMDWPPEKQRKWEALVGV